MNTSPSRPSIHRRWPGRAATLLACFLIAALVLPGGAGWIAQATPLAQEEAPNRLPYGSQFDLPHQPDAAPQKETGPALTDPEYVSWSKLVFQSARNRNDWEIYTARGDGSNQVNISNHGSMDIHPRLNRGATRVVFASNRHGGYDLFTMDANGGGQNRLIDHPGDDVFPAWSPDGNRIAFQAYRDGQPEIYVVNANGSGLARLTYHADYDGQPTWAPDGSQIAFVRRESGGYRIWAMNADGSNQRQLSNQAYSADPAWSPDGSQIAYDADGNGDGWQEIWLMNADGSNQRQVYDPPESNTDAWVGSWSPDGRYVAFTRISFVYYQGQWYWTAAYLDAWDSAQPSNTIRLSHNGEDWNPAWASTDGQAPTSRVLGLPTQSPAMFTVYWTGGDTGGSGLKNYDVQVREGAAGSWTNWQSNTTATSASYTGVGGRAYYFRSRAATTRATWRPGRLPTTR
jgi:Tol biopolymer transport system component